MNVIESFSPINGKLFGTVPVTVSVHKEINNAYEAFLKWRKIPAPARGEFVRLLGNKFRSNKTFLASIITTEIGKTKQEALGEVQEVIDICDFAVGLSRQLHGLTMPSERPQHMLMEQWHSLGPIGVITAFNFPMAVWAWNTAIALVCGDTVVWKPSELAPICAEECLKLVNKTIEEFEAPENIAIVIQGRKEKGSEIVNSKQISLISATGSVDMGKQVGCLAGVNLKKCLLELGGNNAAIVTPSADLDLTIRGLVFSAVGLAGQRCTTLRRIIVHEKIADEVLKRMLFAYDKLNIGDPSNPDTHIGPLINKDAFASYHNMIAKLKDANIKVHGGHRITVSNDTYYVHPAIAQIVYLNEKTINYINTETFAPLVYLIKYKDIDDAIRINNSVPQGLSSSIFTKDINEALYFCGAEGSDCGIANVNIGTSGAEIGGAFGGEKDTGGGRESGSDAWKNYMRRATNTLNFSNKLPLSQGIKFEI